MFSGANRSCADKLTRLWRQIESYSPFSILFCATVFIPMRCIFRHVWTSINAIYFAVKQRGICLERQRFIQSFFMFGSVMSSPIRDFSGVLGCNPDWTMLDPSLGGISFWDERYFQLFRSSRCKTYRHIFRFNHFPNPETRNAFSKFWNNKWKSQSACWVISYRTCTLNQHYDCNY